MSKNHRNMTGTLRVGKFFRELAGIERALGRLIMPVSLWRQLFTFLSKSAPSALANIADIASFDHSGRMTASLTFNYDFSEIPDDDFGWLTIEIVGDGFSGRGGFWVQWQDVTEFSESLSAYPIPQGTTLSAQWGFDMQEGEDLRLRVQIAPTNPKGDLTVTAEVADYLAPSQRVRTSFQTNYPELEAFRSEIARLISRNAGSATLRGS